MSLYNEYSAKHFIKKWTKHGLHALNRWKRSCENSLATNWRNANGDWKRVDKSFHDIQRAIWECRGIVDAMLNKVERENFKQIKGMLYFFGSLNQPKKYGGIMHRLCVTALAAGLSVGLTANAFAGERYQDRQFTVDVKRDVVYASDVPALSIECNSLIRLSVKRSSALSMIKSMQRKWLAVSMMSSTRTLSPSKPMVLVSNI